MIKKLSNSIREYTKDSILAPVFVILEVLLEIIIPLLMAEMIDYGITDGNMDVVTKTGLTLVLLALVALLFGALSGRFAARASAGFAKNLRQDMFYHIQTYDFTNIDKFSTPGLVTRLTTDVTNVQNAYQMIVRVFVRSPTMLVFAMIMAFRINSQLAFIFLGAGIILGVGLFLIMRFAYPLFQKVFKKYDNLNNVVQENLRGIRVVKSYVREEHETEKFHQASEDIYEDFYKAERLVSLNAPLLTFAIYAGMLLLSWLGAQQIVGGTLTTGELTSLFTYAMQILMSLMMLSMVLVMITISRASARRIAEVLEEQPHLHNPENPLYEVADGSVVFKNVSFCYSGEKDSSCLTGVNLDIKSGETIGVIGGTGSSKTTLVQLVPRLYDVTQGELLVGGQDVRAYDLETLRDQVAMVLQNNVLFSGTVAENLRWGKEDATREEMIHACKLASAHDFIEALDEGYDSWVEQGGSNFSGGQRQRLCIARALLKDPRILIMDDSTSAVDMKTDAHIRESMASQIPDTTKIIIAQRIASVQHADQIIVMADGLVDDVGTHEELLERNTIYKEVYTSQQRGGEDVA